jgi:putative endonuclease
MTDKIKTGQLGENLAATYLEQKGYTIRQRNYRYRRSEIDLIAMHDSFLVFVEVKTRTSVAFGEPETFVDDRKLEKLMEGAEEYVLENNWHGHIRFDIVSVYLRDGVPEITHLEDIAL